MLCSHLYFHSHLGVGRWKIDTLELWPLRSKKWAQFYVKLKATFSASATVISTPRDGHSNLELQITRQTHALLWLKALSLSSWFLPLSCAPHNMWSWGRSWAVSAESSLLAAAVATPICAKKPCSIGHFSSSPFKSHFSFSEWSQEEALVVAPALFQQPMKHRWSDTG